MTDCEAPQGFVAVVAVVVVLIFVCDKNGTREAWSVSISHKENQSVEEEVVGVSFCSECDLE